MTRHTTARRARHGWAAICAVGVLGPLGALPACGRDEPGYFGTVGRGGKDAATFYLNNGDEPEYLDPGLVSDTASSALVRELFDGLVLAHPDDQHPVQGVAERYDTSDDNLLYRFHLRADARWTDGEPVTAHDFVYAWQRVLTPATGARNATLLYALTNGKLFHQGKILRLGEAVRPRDGQGTARAELAAGTFVRVYATSPAKLRASRPLADAPEAGASVSVGDDKDGAPVRVLGLGPPLRCNGEGDYWFRLEAGGREGWAPGCALVEDAAHAEVALVSVAVVPTYAPRRPVPAEAAPVAGLVPRAVLVADPSAVGVRAVDDRTLEVELERPTPHFLELCTLPTLSPVPRAVVERFTARGESDRWFRPESIVSNGPYALESWKFRYEISMVRNPHHPDFERLRMHRLVFLQVNDVQACLNLYRTGEIDYIGSNVSLPSAYMDSLAKQGDFSRFVWLGTYWYELNVKAPPVDDVRVRRALGLALDRQLIVDNVTRAGQLPATHYVPDVTGAGYSEVGEAERTAGQARFASPEAAFDPARARALLAEAGYRVVEADGGYRAEGFPPLELLYNTQEGHQKIALAVQDMWKRHLGVSVQLRNEEWKIFLKDVRDGHFQVARFGWVADYNHPQTFLDNFLSYSNNNWTRWKSGAFDELLEKAAATVDRLDAARLYREAEAVAVADMPRLPVYFYTKSTLVKPYVRGFYPNAMNVHPLRYVWLDDKWRAGGPSTPAFPPDELPAPGRFAP